MDIHFEYHDVKASKRLEALVSERINKLLDKNDFIVRADVFFKAEKSSDPEKGKICNIRLSVPGPRIFTEASNGSFEASIAEAANELEIQLRKRKGKMKPHL